MTRARADPHERTDQIRFAPQRPAANALAGAAASGGGGAPSAGAAEHLEGNGGDDFTFSFPRRQRDLYRVYAFGFEVIDDINTANESLTIYDTRSEILGTLDLGAADGDGARLSFYGFIASVPIGYASFDENAASDTIGLAGFVFGYKEYEPSVYPPAAWLAFGGALAVFLGLERLVIRRAGRMDLPRATCWLLVCTGLFAALGLAVFLLRGWRQATIYSVCFTLNGMLSGDNLVVFMLLLQQAGLDEAHHVAAVSSGMLLALAARVALSLAGAVLLQRFSWLLLIFAAFLLVTGCKLLVTSADDAAAAGLALDGRGAAGRADDRTEASEHSSRAVRLIAACVPSTGRTRPAAASSRATSAVG